MVVVCSGPYPPDRQEAYAHHFAAFGFRLSPFQKYAVQAVVDGNHALVCAPTGSGKTLPAEFAVRFFVAQGRRVIYTTPVKALSNQKFHDLTNKFAGVSVGLITGDIKLNPDAQVLVMTTEVLMNALFAPAADERVATSVSFQMDIDKELACVVFDEVHYINDADRGQNWEKAILMLPPQVQMVMLSATLSDPGAFARWCENRAGDGARRQVVLATSDRREVPLAHYVFLASNANAFKGVSDKALVQFARDRSDKAVLLQSATGVFSDEALSEINKLRTFLGCGSRGNSGLGARKHTLNRLATYLKEQDMLPALAFVFSRKHVELCAADITANLLEDDSKVPYTMREECDAVLRKLPNCAEYMALPEYAALVRLLEKGVGIHHSGMIPVLREIVELMISRNQIKLLFATESFAIGLDCAIKTTIFTDVSKFDQGGKRLLHAHEYAQAAGRAGRRGRDVVGFAIHCAGLFVPPSRLEYKALLSGKPQTLVSKFRASYTLVLSLLKSGCGTASEFATFADRSMARVESDARAAGVARERAAVCAALARLEEGAKQLATPRAVALRYAECVAARRASGNKTRRALEAEIAQIEAAHRAVARDVGVFARVDELHREVAALACAEDAQRDEMRGELSRACDVLVWGGFVISTDDDADDVESETKYTLMARGNVASRVSEIHPLVSAEMTHAWRFFADFSPRQIAATLAVFADVKMNDEVRARCEGNAKEGESRDPRVSASITALQSYANSLAAAEDARGFASYTDYDKLLCPAMADAMMDWWDCTDAAACSAFFARVAREDGVAAGDFAKAVTKVSAAAREIAGAAEAAGEIECLHKLSQIDAGVLKHIACNQSLYV
jgi:superfamily II RNA helicase